MVEEVVKLLHAELAQLLDVAHIVLEKRKDVVGEDGGLCVRAEVCPSSARGQQAWRERRGEQANRDRGRPGPGVREQEEERTHMGSSERVSHGLSAAGSCSRSIEEGRATGCAQPTGAWAGLARQRAQGAAGGRKR